MNEYFFDGEYINPEIKHLDDPYIEPVLSPFNTKELAPFINLVVSNNSNSEWDRMLLSAETENTLSHNEKITNFSLSTYKGEIEGYSYEIPLVSFTREFDMSYVSEGEAIAEYNDGEFYISSSYDGKLYPVKKDAGSDYVTIEWTANTTTSGKLTYKNIPVTMAFNFGDDQLIPYLPYYWLVYMDVLSFDLLSNYVEDYDGCIEVSDYTINTTANFDFRSGSRTFTENKTNVSTTMENGDQLYDLYRYYPEEYDGYISVDNYTLSTTATITSQSGSRTVTAEKSNVSTKVESYDEFWDLRNSVDDASWRDLIQFCMSRYMINIDWDYSDVPDSY